MIHVCTTELMTYKEDIRALLQAFCPGVPIVFGEAGNIKEETGEDLYICPEEICRSAVRHEDRFLDKSEIKKALYLYMREITGRDLPWGTLTGIRPVRIAEMLMQNEPEEAAAKRRVQEQFLVSDVKTELMFRIRQREQEVLERLDSAEDLRKQTYRHGFSIYIGIPFCPTRCLYCSFTSNPVAAWSDRIGEYLEAVLAELQQIREWSEEEPRERILQTIYIGGGTPTALSEEQLDVLLCGMEETLGPEMMSSVKELTVEAGRPDSITAGKLTVLKKHHVDRISVNPQTMHQKTLDLIGRAHTVEQTVESFREARAAGFDNINMDLIVGLPGEDLADVRETLAAVRELAPDSLTVHALAVKRSARLSTEGKAWGGVERKGLDAEDADEVGEMTALGAEAAAQMGLEPYYLYRQKNMAGNQENVGYAAPGKECIYNILMMEEKHTVIGVGAGSSSKYVRYSEGGTGASKQVSRHENVKNMEDYLGRRKELLDKKHRFLWNEDDICAK